MKIKIPCDGYSCVKGKIIEYQDFPIPPIIGHCDKCNGKGEIEITETELEKRIDELYEERDEIDEMIVKLTNCRIIY